MVMVTVVMVMVLVRDMVMGLRLAVYQRSTKLTRDMCGVTGRAEVKQSKKKASNNIMVS